MERQPRFPMMSLPRSASNWMSNWQNGNRFYTQMCLHITIWCINRMCRPSSWLSRGTRAGTQETNEYRFIPYSGAFGCGRVAGSVFALEVLKRNQQPARSPRHQRDRESTRLNSSHQINSYAVFC